MIKHISLVLLSIAIVSCAETQEQRALPILGNKDVIYDTIDGKEVADTLYHTIREFEYVNQDSITVTSKDLKGKVWISDFFFSHCPTICPPMTSQMKRLNANLADLADHVQFLSFSIDPKRDGPKRLREYMSEHGIKSENWMFLTGDEAATHELGVNYFFVAATDDADEPGGYAHGDIFTLVDTAGRVRGIYHGTETRAVDSLERDVRKLLKIEYGIEGNK
ncbi:MAG: SCO family protein [Crocinitomicaceae bacterium]